MKHVTCILQWSFFHLCLKQILLLLLLLLLFNYLYFYKSNDFLMYVNWLIYLYLKFKKRLCNNGVIWALVWRRRVLWLQTDKWVFQKNVSDAPIARVVLFLSYTLWKFGLWSMSYGISHQTKFFFFPFYFPKFCEVGGLATIHK